MLQNVKGMDMADGLAGMSGLAGMADRILASDGKYYDTQKGLKKAKNPVMAKVGVNSPARQKSDNNMSTHKRGLAGSK